jgi:hypothetical protein
MVRAGSSLRDKSEARLRVLCRRATDRLVLGGRRECCRLRVWFYLGAARLVIDFSWS